jgi:hypothetical protein
MALVTVRAQQERTPTARLIPAPAVAVPAAVDSNVSMAWDLVDGAWRLFAFPSASGVPMRLEGASIDAMRETGPLEIIGPGHGIWLETIIPDDSGAGTAITTTKYRHSSAAARIERFRGLARRARSIAVPRGRTSAPCWRRRLAARRAGRPTAM